MGTEKYYAPRRRRRRRRNFAFLVFTNLQKFFELLFSFNETQEIASDLLKTRFLRFGPCYVAFFVLVAFCV